MIVSKLCSRAPRLILQVPKSNFMSRAKRGIRQNRDRIVVEKATEAEPFEKGN